MEVIMKNLSHLEVTRYFIDKDGAIKITHIKAIDHNDKYIKFVKLSDVLPYLSTLKVVWKPLEK
jgi:hypothetical protein